MEPKRPQTVYRAPAAKFSVEQMAAKLGQMESSFRTRWISLIALGAVVTVIGPVVVATLMWFFNHTPGSSDPQAWTFVFFKVSAVLLPLVFGIEWLTRGKMFERTAEAVGDLGPLGTRSIPGVGRGLAIISFLEMCLWGPRMVIGGTKKIFGQGQHAGADRSLAAKMLHAMYVKDGGVPTAQLYPLAGGRDDAFGDALAYLLFFDLIGIAKTGDRAWMLGDAKRDLKLS